MLLPSRKNSPKNENFMKMHIQNVDEFVSSSGLEKSLSNGCSAVNGFRQNESLIKTSQ